MKIEQEFEQRIKDHLTYVIRDHIVASAEYYADVALGTIAKQPPEIDDVTIRVDIRFRGLMGRLDQFQKGEVDAI